MDLPANSQDAASYFASRVHHIVKHVVRDEETDDESELAKAAAAKQARAISSTKKKKQQQEQEQEQQQQQQHQQQQQQQQQQRQRPTTATPATSAKASAKNKSSVSIASGRKAASTPPSSQKKGQVTKRRLEHSSGDTDGGSDDDDNDMSDNLSAATPRLRPKTAAVAHTAPSASPVLPVRDDVKAAQQKLQSARSMSAHAPIPKDPPPDNVFYKAAAAVVDETNESKQNGQTYASSMTSASAKDMEQRRAFLINGTLPDGHTYAPYEQVRDVKARFLAGLARRHIMGKQSESQGVEIQVCVCVCVCVCVSVSVCLYSFTPAFMCELSDSRLSFGAPQLSRRTSVFSSI